MVSGDLATIEMTLRLCSLSFVCYRITHRMTLWRGMATTRRTNTTSPTSWSSTLCPMTMPWVIYLYYSKFARDHHLGWCYIFRLSITQKLKMACIQGHVYFLNFIAVCQMWTLGNMRSVIKEADPQKWRLSPDPPKTEVSECYSKSWKCPKQFNCQQQQLSIACVSPT